MTTESMMNIMMVALCIVYSILKLELTHADPEATDVTRASIKKSKDTSICIRWVICFDKGYNVEIPPNPPLTEVFFNYSSPEILEIREKQKSITLGIQIRTIWEDCRIKVFSYLTWSLEYEFGYNIMGVHIPWHWYKYWEGSKSGGLPVWYPDGIGMVNIIERNVEEMYHPFTSISFVTGTEFIKMFKGLPKNEWQIADPNTTAIIVKRDLRVTVPCDFDASRFPFDVHVCKFGHSNEDARNLIPKFYPLMKLDSPPTFLKDGFEITRLLENGTRLKKYSYIGLNFKIKRILGPFVFQYYLPSAAIVFVSQISFVIPSSATPGRVGLLATLFLTLTNLFIHHMVRLFTWQQTLYYLSFTIYGK